MNDVDAYLNRHEGVQKEWLTTFVSFMREQFPQLPEGISYQIPTYKFDKTYIAFSVAKEHFTFHTTDFEMIEALKTQLPNAKFGRGSAKVPYTSRESIPILFEMARTIVARHHAG
jgi:uncharacterized protein YdhG (YjbR/CyaY superfamily)